MSSANTDKFRYAFKLPINELESIRNNEKKNEKAPVVFPRIGWSCIYTDLFLFAPERKACSNNYAKNINATRQK